MTFFEDDAQHNLANRPCIWIVWKFRILHHTLSFMSDIELPDVLDWTLAVLE